MQVCTFPGVVDGAAGGSSSLGRIPPPTDSLCFRIREGPLARYRWIFCMKPRSSLQAFQRRLDRVPGAWVVVAPIGVVFRVLESAIYASALASRLGVKKLSARSIDFLPPKRERKILFILGRGPTRTEIVKKYGRVIAEHFSIGINDSNYLDFTPTAESREEAPVDWFLGETWPTANPVELSDDDQTGPNIVPKGREGIAILQKASVSQNEDWSMPPVKASDRIWIYSSIGNMTTRKEVLAWNVKISIKLLRLFPSFPVLFGSQASVVRMLSFGLKFGFQEMVLVGVDLKGSSPTPDNTGEESWIHKTAVESESQPITVQETIRLFARATESSTRISVGHRDSLLASFLPVFPWQQHLEDLLSRDS